MPKVRDVFERAYGPTPEGATCHVGYPDGHKGGAVRPTYRSLEGEAYARIRHSAGDKFFATCHDNKKGREFFTKAMAMEWAEIQSANWQGCEVTA